MSFSFNFDVDEEADADLVHATESFHLDATPEPSTSSIAEVPYAEVPLSELLDSLPPLISYTPIQIPLSSASGGAPRHTTLLRRDLFDARFQIIAENEYEDEDEDDDDAEEETRSSSNRKSKGKGKEAVFVDERTDLVANVYEGGLKTWECSLDLVDSIESLGLVSESTLRGKSVLELGCGTALPSCFLFYTLLKQVLSSTLADSDPTPEFPTTTFHLQDYNKQVLSLITLPNFLLAYAHVLASEHGELPPGEVEITPEFLAAFESMLKRHSIELRFYEGSWSGMKTPSLSEGKRYDIVLASETIYSLPSLPSLLAVLQSSCYPTGEEAGANESKSETNCLIAAKRIYFGVGGGELEFKRRVEALGGKVQTVWGDGKGDGKDKGVGRVVMSVTWP